MRAAGTPWVLGLDASGPGLAVGAVAGEAVVADFWWTLPRTAGDHLLAWVEPLAEALGPPGLVGVGIGPGSFTGIRVAVTAAKMLAYGWGVPVVGVSSLEAWAWAIPVGRAGLVTGERRGPAFYLAAFRRQPEGVERLSPDLPQDGWQRLPAEILGLAQAEPLAVLGPMGEVPEFLERLGGGAYPWAEPLRASAVARLAQARHRQGMVDDPWALVPSYLRRPHITQRLQRG